MSDSIDIEVAYALPERQVICALSVPSGTTALEAVTRSDIVSRFEGLSLDDLCHQLTPLLKKRARLLTHHLIAQQGRVATREPP